ncbi:hypothetical protein M8J77_007672 [Diaphorina citri]|nr:hypothetical protein M8J77_007672 [Diaphorina citri]
MTTFTSLEIIIAPDDIALFQHNHSFAPIIISNTNNTRNGKEENGMKYKPDITGSRAVGRPRERCDRVKRYDMNIMEKDATDRGKLYGMPSVN